MTHIVHCTKLGIESEGLSEPPFPTTLGQRIYDQISQQAWDLWIAHQTMLINEYKLSLIEKKSRDFLIQEMEKFLFGGNAEKPPGFRDMT
ncbi:MAG: oxidative damage protection protein [Gammaproteobacteria bacterium RIFCSPHIGHO2_12_FULL_38_11]|nr:MAG: oxidative damage protection protein [Gammaproteobacteria bacterium RIFCSPHIGHO2_12_FULL_38_11]